MQAHLVTAVLLSCHDLLGTCPRNFYMLLRRLRNTPNVRTRKEIGRLMCSPTYGPRGITFHSLYATASVIEYTFPQLKGIPIRE